MFCSNCGKSQLFIINCNVQLWFGLHSTFSFPLNIRGIILFIDNLLLHSFRYTNIHKHTHTYSEREEMNAIPFSYRATSQIKSFLKSIRFLFCTCISMRDLCETILAFYKWMFMAHYLNYYMIAYKVVGRLCLFLSSVMWKLQWNSLPFGHIAPFYSWNILTLLSVVRM